jgi:hypothetical protein
MGACRETMDIFYYLKKSSFDGKRNYKKAWYLIRHFNKTIYGDTFGPYICKIKGHKAFKPDPRYQPNEWACSRCNKYITWNDRKEKLLKLKKVK